MQQEVLFYFEKRLLLHDECTLPDLGSFSITPTGIPKKTMTAESAHYTLQFNAVYQEANANKLITYICIKEDISEIESRNAVGTYVLGINQQLREHAIAQFGHWGELRKNTAGIIVFQPYYFIDKQLTHLEVNEVTRPPIAATKDELVRPFIASASSLATDKLEAEITTATASVVTSEEALPLSPTLSKEKKIRNIKEKQATSTTIKKWWVAAASVLCVALVSIAAYFATRSNPINNNILSYYPKGKESSQVSLVTNPDSETAPSRHINDETVKGSPSSQAIEKSKELDKNLVNEKENKAASKNLQDDPSVAKSSNKNIDISAPSVVQKEAKPIEIATPTTVLTEKESTKTAEMNPSNSLDPSLDAKTTVEHSSSTATYPGGPSELRKFLIKNLNSSVATQNGTVTLLVTVNEEGKVTNSSVVASLNPACDKEALRVVNKMNKWIPAKQNGTPVTQKITIPITFRTTDNLP
jgi:TonB family protein